MLRFIVATIVFVLGSLIFQAQQLIDVIEVNNRSARTQSTLIDSFAIVRRNAKPAFDPRQLRLRRCDDKSEVPFYLEPWQPGADSVLCWFRLENVPGSDTVLILVELDSSLTTSKSNGRAVFLSFRDNSAVPAGTGANGPWSSGVGTIPDFGRGIHLDARITARAPTGGYFCYFGNNAAGNDGYVIKHEARSGRTDADHLRIKGGNATPLASGADSANFVWNVNETVRYDVMLTGVTNSVYRQSESNPMRRHRAVATRDTGMTWTMFGVAAFPQAAQDIGVSFIRARPIYDFKPRSARRDVQITATPADGAICNGDPVVLSIPAAGWKSLKWSTGETTPSIVASANGSYYVDLIDGSGCALRTSAFRVVSDSNPVAGNDTTITLCLGRTDTLRVKPGYAEYVWLMSSGLKLTKLAFTGPTAVVDSADVYRCIVRSASGCIDTVRFIVNRVYDNTAKITFPFTTPTLCDNDTLTLRAFPPQAISFQWSRNGEPLSEKSDRLVVRDSGTYSVVVRVGNNIDGCLSLATIRVERAIRQPLQIQPRYTVCEGDSVVIAARGYTQVDWWRISGGKLTERIASGETLVCKNTDTIRCIVSVNGSCADSASTIIERRLAPPFSMTVKENKKSICRGEYLTLMSSLSGYSYRWKRDSIPLQTKDDSSAIQIDDAGTYYLTVDYGNSCSRTDSIVINSGLEPPDLLALDGVAICPGSTTRLTTLGRFNTYLWSTGETSDTITVSKPGRYSVKVSLFGCESRSEILIQEADTNGPDLAYRDSTMICEASQYAWLVFTNKQIVPRLYNVTVLDSTAIESSVRRFSVNAQDTGSVGFRFINGIPTARFSSFRVRLSDDCNWSRELELTVESREKTIPLDIALSLPVDEVRSGDNFTMRLVGSTRAGLPDFTRRDTLWIETCVSPDLLEIQSTWAACGDQLTVMNDKLGRVRFSLTDCANSSADPLIEQKLSALVGETLQGFIMVDSIYSTSPCITAPMSSRRYDINLLPFGCEIKTITRTQTLILGIGGVDNGTVTAVITRSNGPVTVRAVDVLGRILDSVVVPESGDPRSCRLSTHSESLVYVTATDATSTVTLSVAGAGR